MSTARMKNIIGFVLGEDESTIEEFAEAAVSNGYRPFLVCPCYEIDVPDKVAGHKIHRPMDFLSERQADAIYDRLLDWQRQTPGVKLADGTRLENWRAEKDHPETLWMWLVALVPNVHTAMRLVHGLKAMVDRQKSSAYALVGASGMTNWMRMPIRSVMTTFAPRSREVGVWVEGANLLLRDPEPAFEPEWPPTIVPPKAPAPVPRALREKRQKAVEERVHALLGDTEDSFRARARGNFAGHALLIMRGSRGTQWLYSPATGNWRLVDEYSEQMPEALIAACQAENWRLTICYEGAAPDYTAARRSYSDRYPSLVSEIALNSVAGLASAMRAPVRAGYEKKIDELMLDEAFRAVFCFETIDFVDVFGDYLRRSIVNLSALTVTQLEVFRALFDKLRPDVVFGGRLEAKPYVNQAAHECGARVLSIKLGIGEEMLPAMTARRSDGTYALLQYPDRYALWGEFQKKLLKKRLPESGALLAVSGRARNDTFVVDAAGLDTRNVRKKLGLEPGQRVVIYGANFRSRYGMWPGQPFGSSCISGASWRAGLETLLDVAAKTGNTRVIVKPHPVDDLDFMREVIEQTDNPHVSLVTTEDKLHNVELLSVCDVFVSTVSSMFAEAAILGRVSVNLWLPEENYIYESGRRDTYNKLAVGAGSVREVGEIVERLLNDDDWYSEQLKRITGNLGGIFGGFDGRNADRAVSLGMMLKNRKGRAARTKVNKTARRTKRSQA